MCSTDLADTFARILMESETDSIEDFLRVRNIGALPSDLLEALYNSAAPSDEDGTDGTSMEQPEGEQKPTLDETSAATEREVERGLSGGERPKDGGLATSPTPADTPSGGSSVLGTAPGSQGMPSQETGEGQANAPSHTPRPSAHQPRGGSTTPSNAPTSRTSLSAEGGQGHSESGGTQGATQSGEVNSQGSGLPLQPSSGGSSKGLSDSVGSHQPRKGVSPGQSRRGRSQAHKTKVGRLLSYAAGPGEVDQPNSADDPEKAAAREATGRAAVEYFITTQAGRWKSLTPMPHNNPGFDVHAIAHDDQEEFIEVKGQSGAWTEEGVALTPTELMTAQQKGDRYWLCVVEYAQDKRRKPYLIRNPYGLTQQFRFDVGWKSAAQSVETVPLKPEQGMYIDISGIGTGQILSVREKGRFFQVHVILDDGRQVPQAFQPSNDESFEGADVARMIPQLTEEQLKAFPSRAEARFYEACRDRLPEDIVVIYSANWIYRDARGRLNEGEADFTILSPQTGLLAVEVKGGGVSFDAATGAWHSVDRNGKLNAIKDPFKQASRERHALLDQITGHASWRQWTGSRFTIGHAVMLPDIGDPSPLIGPDRQRELVGVNADIQNVAQWYDRVMRFWSHANDDALGAKGVRLIEDILCKSIEVRPVLRAAVDDAEQQRIRLTANQAKVFRVIGGRRRAVVSGGAGTGKTVLALEKAKALASAGLKVLLLCYNRPLADSLAISLKDELLIQAQSYHQLCDQRIRQAHQKGHDILKEAVEAYPGTGDQHHFDVLMPYALALSADVLEERFDALVVDEAQDFSDEYWLGVEMLLRDQENSHLYIFIDENQVLYPRKAKLPVEDEPFYLTNNCRNSAPIHEVGYCFYQGIPIDPPELIGHDVIWTGLEKVEAQADAVAKRVRQWVQVEGLKPEDVAVLVAKRPKGFAYDLLEQRAEAAGAKWVFEAHGKAKCVLVDTVARFKGLEAQAVVLWVGDEVVDEAQWETLYVGSTRAKSLLNIVGSPKAVKELRTHPRRT